MTKYQAYPEYKDSDVEWIGKVPLNWDLKRIKNVSTFNDEVLSESHSKYFKIEYVDIGSVSSVDGIKLTSLIEFGKSPSRARRIVRDGDIIVSTVRTYLKAISPILNPPANMVVSTGFAVIRPNLFLFNRFAAYVLREDIFINKVIAKSVGISYPSINASDLVNIEIILPHLTEQTQIAKFLDYETAKIDTLIEKQQQLIKLLKEKRQAVISHAVTKGLNSDAPMRDSGVEWLGEVPKHWKVSRIGFYAKKIGSGKTPKGGSEIYKDSGILFLRSQNIYDNGLKVDNGKSVYISNEIHKEMKNTKVKSGDILLNITGGSIGRTCIVPNNFREANVNQHVCILRFSDSIRDYLSFVLKSDLIKEQIDFHQTGGNREGLNFEQISKFIINFPPEEERKEILNYIESNIKKYNYLEDKADKAIRLIRERRTALISATVTGKIDVRNWQPPSQNQTNGEDKS